MFLKPFRIKNCYQIKSTERKVLKNNIIEQYADLGADIDNIFTNKDVVTVSKIITRNNEICLIYSVNKQPLFFQYEKIFYPTVYFLWKYPNLVKYFTTYDTVITKLCAGANLMLPGVVFPDKNDSVKFEQFEKGTLIAVNSTTNKAAFAIGETVFSSADMYMTGGRGKCLNIIHSYQDYLCRMEIQGTQIVAPEFGPPDWLIKPPATIQSDIVENNNEGIQDEQIDNSIKNNEENMETSNELQLNNSNATDEMDNLLNYCFLKVLKYSKKKIQLPCLTSNFYRSFIINACPQGKQLDIKKTSFKKLNKFLFEMSAENIISVTEQTKGVEVISSINYNHPKITSFVGDPDDIFEQIKENNSVPINIQENYIVTAAVLPLFSNSGFRKGDAITASQVRLLVTEYVKKRKLNSLDNRNLIIPNKDLEIITKTDKEVTWEELMQAVFKLMSNSFKIESCTGVQVSGKGKVEPIILTISSRSGNKKVTLVDNLELFGIRVADFGKECQHGVATSTSVTKPPGKKYEQLLVQGNQIAFVGQLLIDKYKIPRQYIRGLELAIKSKKKK